MSGYRKTSFLSRIIDSILEWVEVIVLSVFLVILVFSFFLRVVEVEGKSMNSTLFDSDMLLVTHILYEPKNGDIVVLDSEVLNETVVKRVIATEGQTVVVDYVNSAVYVDGEKLYEDDYIKEKIMFDNEKNFDQLYYDKNEMKYTYVVPENSIFVMGDNRNNSTDSRSFGFVSVDCVLGKVFFRMTSPYGDVGLID